MRKKQKQLFESYIQLDKHLILHTNIIKPSDKMIVFKLLNELENTNKTNDIRRLIHRLKTVVGNKLNITSKFNI